MLVPRQAVLLFATCASAVFGAVEFTGVLITPQQSLLCLTDTVTQKVEWHAVGELFAGYRLREFDQAHDRIVLEKDGVVSEISLALDAAVSPARIEIAGTLQLGADEKIRIDRATLQFDVENTFPVKPDTLYRITPTRRPDGQIQYRASIERVLAGNKTELISLPAIVARPGQPFSIRAGGQGFSFTPRL